MKAKQTVFCARFNPQRYGVLKSLKNIKSLLKKGGTRKWMSIINCVLLKISEVLE